LNDVVKQSGNITVQWCLLSEPLNESVHVKGAHGYATGWDGRTKGGGSFHHNLIAHAASRAPRIGYFKVDRGLIDCRNNVIYNSGASYGGETDDFNYVANYYRPGPDSAKIRDAGDVFDIWSDDSRMYVSGNVFEGMPQVLKDNASCVLFKQGKTADGERKKGNAQMCLVAEPFKVPPVTSEDAETAYPRVLDDAGAIVPRRDAVDERIINDVRNRTGHIINSPDAVGGWPELKSAPAPADADHDGMPNDWETAHRLNPHDAADGARPSPNHYTNLEIYLDELAGKRAGQ
jgi:hypothetical protein